MVTLGELRHTAPEFNYRKGEKKHDVTARLPMMQCSFLVIKIRLKSPFELSAKKFQA